MYIKIYTARIFVVKIQVVYFQIFAVEIRVFKFAQLVLGPFSDNSSCIYIERYTIWDFPEKLLFATFVMFTAQTFAVKI